MGFFSDLFKGGSQTATSTQSTSLPPWLNNAAKSEVQQAQNLAARPFPTYTGARLADFTPDQTQAMDMTRSNSGSWQDAFNKAMGATATGSAPITADDINRYMNPYNQDVVDATSNDISHQLGLQRVQDDANLAKRKSFGNDRTSVVDSLRNDAGNRLFASTVAPLRQQGFTTALGAAQGDKSRSLTAAQLYSLLGPLISSLGAGDASRLFASGSAQQAQKQQGLDISYQDFMNNFLYPQSQLSWASDLTRGVPHGTTTTGTQQLPATNPLAEGLGAFASGVGGIGHIMKMFSTPDTSSLFAPSSIASPASDSADAASILASLGMA